MEIRFDEGYPPVIVRPDGDGLVVEDAADEERPEADLVVAGALPDVLRLARIPMAAGLPKLASREGRAAVGSLARGRVRLAGSKLLARRLLRLLAI